MCTCHSLRSSNHSSREQLSAFALKIQKTTALCGYGFHDRVTYDTVICSSNITQRTSEEHIIMDTLKYFSRSSSIEAKQSQV